MHRKQPRLRTLENYALFLDIDGTLADIAPEPSLAFVAPSTVSDLKALSISLNGALALVSGRQLAEIDKLVGLAGISAAGIHGAQLRTQAGTRLVQDQLPEVFVQIEAEVRNLTRALEGIRFELKPLAVAIHFRANPKLESHIHEIASSVVSKHAGLKLIKGKCIAEILPDSVNKGNAIAELMQSLPFRGRVPVFAGDDVTDEDGFTSVNSMKGISIKIGNGPSNAVYGFETAAKFRAWLSQLLCGGAEGTQS